ncbi:Neuronal acetylcholine receptor subunit alpha-7-like [Mactra antiquata]
MTSLNDHPLEVLIQYYKVQANPVKLDRLYDQLFANYTNQVLPRCDGEAVQVQVGIMLRQIIDLNEPRQILESNAWIRMVWNDCNLKWNATETGIKNMVVPYKSLWIPDITLYDNAQTDLGGLQDYRPNLYPDGTVYYNFPSVIKSLCRVDVTYFPFDVQQCKMKFGSWSYHGWDVNFTKRPIAGDTSMFVANGEWKLLGIPAIRHEVIYNCCEEPYPDVTFYIQIKRKPLFYLLNLIFPCTLISTVAFLGFLLPPDSGEKISLEITVLLSLAVFLLVVGETMPPDSETFPFIGVYFACAMLLVSMSCLMTVIVLNVHFRGSHGKKLPNWIRRIFFDCLGRILLVKHVAKEPRRVKHDRWVTPCKHSHGHGHGHGHDHFVLESHMNSGFLNHPSDDIPNNENNINKIINDINDELPKTLNIPDIDNNSSHELIRLLKQQAETLDNIRDCINEKAELEDIMEEWKVLAQVMDRIFMILFFLFQVVTSLVILLRISTTEITLETD